MENLTEWIAYEWITYGVQKHLIEEDFFVESASNNNKK